MEQSYTHWSQTFVKDLFFARLSRRSLKRSSTLHGIDILIRFRWQIYSIYVLGCAVAVAAA